ncbi:MAG: beta-N-acetylglucosaminidase domain-containing protein [Acidobacteriota bacterium]
MKRKDGGLLLAVWMFCLPLLAQESFVHLAAAKFESRAAGVWEASFELGQVLSPPLFLFLKARSLGLIASPPGIEVGLNGESIFRGEWNLSPTFWRIKRFPAPAKGLRAGSNVLTVSISSKPLAEAAPPSIEIGGGDLADFQFVPLYDPITDFEVELPSVTEPLPSPAPQTKAGPAFPIRGTKGWAWTPDQYLAEIPFLARTRMNFLMNCYTSMFSSLDPFVNRWWEPLPEDKRKGFEEVVRACRQNNIQFCFSMHPQLFSERPLEVGSEEDFEKLWQHYAWMQSLGVKWFNLCYDDIGVEGQDKSVLGEIHAGLVNRLLGRLREKTTGAQFIFCPTYYAGCGETPEAGAYLRALGRTLHPDVYLFWTGDGVVTPKISAQCARAYRNIAGRRLIIWDNYPVNDRTPTLHLGPVSGRERGLAEVALGYMSNPLSPQNEINRLPLFTSADYAINPRAYDPWRAIGRSIVSLAENETQRQALKSLVELYPGMLVYGDTRTSFNPVMERFRGLLRAPGGRDEAVVFVRRVEEALKQLSMAFPDQFARTKATIAGHIAAMQRELK